MLKHWVLGLVLALAPASAWATCSDLAQNGDETDVDCGGSCSPCADGLHCAIGADCISASCTATVCDATATTTTTTTSTTTTTYPPASSGQTFLENQSYAPAGGYAYDTGFVSFPGVGAYEYLMDLNGTKLMHADFSNTCPHDLSIILVGGDNLEGGLNYTIYEGTVSAAASYHYEAPAYYRFYAVAIVDGVGGGYGRFAMAGK